MGVRAIGHSMPSTGRSGVMKASAMDRSFARVLGVSVLSLALTLSWLPAAEAGPADTAPGLSPAAASARALLNGPRPSAPVTTHAGMGTADPPLPAPIAGGVDAAGNGEAATRPASQTQASGIDAAGNGEARAAPAPTNPAAASNGRPEVAPATMSAASDAARAVPEGQAQAAPAHVNTVQANTGQANTGQPNPVQAVPAQAAARPATAVQPASTQGATAQAAPTQGTPGQAAREQAAPAQPGAAQAVAAPASSTTPASAQPAQAAARGPVPPASSAQQAPIQAQAPSTVAAPVPPAPAAASPAARANAAPVTAPASTAATSPAAGTMPTEGPAAAPVAAAPIQGPLAPVAEAVAMQIAQPGGLGSTKKEAEALSAFYGARQGLPVFVDERGVNARGAAVLARLHAAAEDGLDPADYAVALPPRGADAAALAQAELRLAVAALTYARHAQSGRFEPSRISDLVTPSREIPDPAAILATLAEARDANATLAAFNPPHTGYKALKARLAVVDRPRDASQVMIPAGGLMKPGDSDPRVPALRARLGLSGAPGNLSYDPALVDAVKAFQVSARLKPTGVVGAGTLTALNRAVVATPSADMKAELIANMERWRWLPRDLGAYYVWVNIPEYLARIHEGDKVIHETRIVVGKKETPTPLLTQDMRYAVVNPAWNIPPSIARKEMMPLLRSDPDALSRRGIEVVRNGSGGYTFRQSPGERNALGRIKFMFPNDHSVYLHDTPSKSLFSRDERAFSHGCMRVQDPLEFGEVLFNIGLPGENWSAQRIGKMFGGKERYVTLKQRIPVHVVYFTTFVNDAGRIETRDDIYGINAEVKSRLGLDSARRRLAEGNASSARR